MEKSNDLPKISWCDQNTFLDFWFHMPYYTILLKWQVLGATYSMNLKST